MLYSFIHVCRLECSLWLQKTRYSGNNNTCSPKGREGYRMEIIILLVQESSYEKNICFKESTYADCEGRSVLSDLD